MRDLLVFLVHFLTTLARLLGPGGTRAVIAETLLIKHQLVILNRSRRRAPNLTAADRIVMGLCTLFMNPSRIRKVAAALKPTTLLGFHRALKERKYRRLFSPQRRGEPAAGTVRLDIQLTKDPHPTQYHPRTMSAPSPSA